jgi:AcrR family transcriptional regulator
MGRAPTAAREAATRHAGRPRRPDVEDRVLDAAIELLRERGLAGTTMSAVIERSGVARATVYLRWPHRQDLIAAAVRRVLGVDVARATGSAEADVRAGGHRMARALRDPTFRSVLPALVAALSTPPEDPARVSYDAIAPGRFELADEYDAIASEQGLRADLGGGLVMDVTLGAFLGAFLGSGTPPSDAVADRILDMLVDGLRLRPGEAERH